MSIHHANGFAKQAFLAATGAAIARGATSIAGRLAAAGGLGARAAPTVQRAASSIATNSAKAEAGFRSVGRSLSGAGNNMTRGTRTVVDQGAMRKMDVAREVGPTPTKTIKGVGSRIMTRGMWGAGIGAGSSMIGDKLRGEDVNVGKALTRGAVGGALGAAAGTTVGKRFIRRVTHPHASPSLSFTEAANPMKWGKALSGQKGVPGSAVTKPLTAWGAMSPLEKGFTAMSAYDAGKAIVKPEENSGERIGGAVGNVGAMMAGSRWKGMRRTWKPGGGGMWGSAARSMALLTAGDVAGRAVGRQGNKLFNPKGEQEAADVPQ